jgi:hypothetical protein
MKTHWAGAAFLIALALALAAALSFPAPAFAGSDAALVRRLPPSVLAEVESFGCASEEGPPVYERGFVSWRDALGHGRVDVVLDYGHFLCHGGDVMRLRFPACVATGCLYSGFCGSSGCGTQVFVRLPDGRYRKVFDRNAFSVDFAVFRRGVRTMTAVLHGGACGGFGAQPCSVTLYWDGVSFVCPKRPPHYRYRADDACRIDGK